MTASLAPVAPLHCDMPETALNGHIVVFRTLRRLAIQAYIVNDSSLKVGSPQTANPVYSWVYGSLFLERKPFPTIYSKFTLLPNLVQLQYANISMVASSITDAFSKQSATWPVAKSPATVSPIDNILIADCHFHNYPCIMALVSIKQLKAMHP